MSGRTTRRAALKSIAGAAAMSAWPGAVASEAPPGASSLHYATLTEIAALIQSKQLSPVELTELMLRRIESVDGTLHSYVTVMADAAMDSARHAEREIAAGRYRGPLHGVPIGVKDLCYTRGAPTMGGTRVLAGFVPEHDATAVARLKAAGAVILGKLTLCEGAMAPYHPALEVPVNPWDATRWSGVSSSGSGVATAAGLCFVSIGTDTGGSIRYPSAANGCVGLKPTYGRVSRHGVLALAESLDHVGPMARSVEDAAIAFEAMAGFDDKDPTSRREPVEPVRPALDQGVKGLRIGFDRRYAADGVEPGLAQALDAVLAELSRLGAEVVPVTMPDVTEVGSAWWQLATAEAAAFHADTFPARAEEYGPGFRDVLAYGASVTGVSYANAARVRAEVSGRVDGVLAQVDCLVCPSMSNVAPAKLEDPFGPDLEGEWAMLVLTDVHTKPFNFSGSPTLSVPCGFAEDGLPFSVQFVGAALSEAKLCRIGHAYERVTPWRDRHPAV